MDKSQIIEKFKQKLQNQIVIKTFHNPFLEIQTFEEFYPDGAWFEAGDEEDSIDYNERIKIESEIFEQLFCETITGFKLPLKEYYAFGRFMAGLHSFLFIKIKTPKYKFNLPNSALPELIFSSETQDPGYGSYKTHSPDLEDDYYDGFWQHADFELMSREDYIINPEHGIYDPLATLIYYTMTTDEITTEEKESLLHYITEGSQISECIKFAVEHYTQYLIPA